jgi:hypothetical protein
MHYREGEPEPAECNSEKNEEMTHDPPPITVCVTKAGNSRAAIRLSSYGKRASGVILRGDSREVGIIRAS